MVYGFIVGKIVYVAASFAVRPYLPRLRAKWSQFMEFYAYGKHVFRGSAVDYVVSQLDKLLIGRILGAQALGLYSVAWRVASMPATGIYGVVFRVAFPVFSRIQSEPSRLRDGFLRALQMMGAVSAPIAAGLFAVAPDFVPVVLSAKWVPVIGTFRLLCVAGGFLSLCYLIRSVLSAVGRPDLAARSAYLFLAVMGLPIYPAIHRWGNPGAAACLAGATFICLVQLLLMTDRVLGGVLADSLKALAAPFLGSLGMSAGVMALRAGIPLGPAPLALAAQVVAGVALYVLLAGGLDRLGGGALMRSVRGLVRPA